MTRTDCWDGGDDLTELQLVENGGLSGGIETNHQNTHLLLTPEPVEQLAECETHDGGIVCSDLMRFGKRCYGRLYLVDKGSSMRHREYVSR